MLLPYIESYGSGALLLGMTFDKYILATRTGGMDEYLEGYPRYKLLSGVGVEEILLGMKEALDSPAWLHRQPDRSAELDWKNIARELVTALNAEHRATNMGLAG